MQFRLYSTKSLFLLRNPIFVTQRWFPLTTYHIKIIATCEDNNNPTRCCYALYLINLFSRSMLASLRIFGFKWCLYIRYTRIIIFFREFMRKRRGFICGIFLFICLTLCIICTLLLSSKKIANLASLVIAQNLSNISDGKHNLDPC